MGLDIIAYRKLKKNKRLSNLSNNKKEYIDIDCLIMSPYLEEVEEAFPGRAEPLKYNGDVYICDECENINIGSYGTYGWFRQALETFSKDSDYFNELIDFSDCEGVIGSVVSEKLYKDFSSNAESFGQWVCQNYSTLESGLLLRMYYKFKSAFEIAKDGGAVEFC